MHRVSRDLGDVEQDDLVVLDNEAGQVGRVVGHQVGRGKRLDATQPVGGESLRAGHRLIVEKMANLPRGGSPPHVPLLTRTPLSL